MKNADMPVTPLSKELALGVAESKPLALAAMGLTKREYFAAMALQGLLSIEEPDEEISSAEKIEFDVENAVYAADLLLKELEK